MFEGEGDKEVDDEEDYEDGKSQVIILGVWGGWKTTF